MIYYIETAAHNFLNKTASGKWVESTDITFYHGKVGEESYVAYQVVKFFCHPKYDGRPSCGYDYAVAIVDMDSIEYKNFDKEHYNFNTVRN